MIRNRNGNFGNVVYSSRKLNHAGFRFPFGLQNGLNDAVSLLRSSPTARCGGPGQAR
jgi:hypothetical protein